MNILMVNPVHPSTPHISAVRAWRFSQELARLGHRVVYLTLSDRSPEDHEIPNLTTHDWSTPAVVAIPVSVRPETQSSLPATLRRFRTALRLLSVGGSNGAWVRRAAAAFRDSQCLFRPDVVWCTVGMFEAAILAKRIAKMKSCPWVVDIKDNWNLYVPRGLRHLMAMRIGGWTTATANAKFTWAVAAPYLNSSATVIYSGVDFEYFGDESVAPPSDQFVVNLIGSVYSTERLTEFLKGFATWLAKLDSKQRESVLLRYFGGDQAHVDSAVRACHHDVAVEKAGYASPQTLAHCCKAAAVNAYIAFPATFHHKLLELIACGRPVIAMGSEHEESIELASQLRGDLTVVSDADGVASVLNRVYVTERAGTRRETSATPNRIYSWPNQARALERVLIKAMGQKASQ